MFYFTCDRSFTALNAFLDRDECFRFEGQKVRVQGHSGIEYAHVSTFTKFYVLIPCVFFNPGTGPQWLQALLLLFSSQVLVIVRFSTC